MLRHVTSQGPAPLIPLENGRRRIGFGRFLRREAASTHVLSEIKRQQQGREIRASDQMVPRVIEIARFHRIFATSMRRIMRPYASRSVQGSVRRSVRDRDHFIYSRRTLKAPEGAPEGAVGLLTETYYPAAPRAPRAMLPSAACSVRTPRRPPWSPPSASLNVSSIQNREAQAPIGHHTHARTSQVTPTSWLLLPSPSIAIAAHIHIPTH